MEQTFRILNAVSGMRCDSSQMVTTTANLLLNDRALIKKIRAS